MIKNLSILQVKRGENIHQYLLPSQCTIGEVLDVLTEFRSYALNIMIEEQKKADAQIKEMQEKQKKEEKQEENGDQ